MGRRIWPVMLLACSELIVASAVAQAQFTTFIAPKPRIADSVKVVRTVQQRQAQADSVTSAQIANMKMWVDSAAGMPAQPAVTDTVAPPAEVSLPNPPAMAATSPTRRKAAFANGETAPATASLAPAARGDRLSGTWIRCFAPSERPTTGSGGSRLVRRSRPPALPPVSDPGRRRTVAAFSLCGAGALLLAFAAARYSMGLVHQDAAMRSWDLGERTVAVARRLNARPTRSTGTKEQTTFPCRERPSLAW